MQMEIHSSQHVGPVPAPATIAQYDQIVPGAANRMIEMAERDQTAFIKSNSNKQKLDFAFNLACLFAGLLGLGLILWVIILLAEGGHDWLGAAVAGIGISGIVTAFVNARNKKPD